MTSTSSTHVRDPKTAQIQHPSGIGQADNVIAVGVGAHGVDHLWPGHANNARTPSQISDTQGQASSPSFILRPNSANHKDTLNAHALENSYLWLLGSCLKL